MIGEIKRSVCPYDCPDACGLLVEVIEDKVVGVAGDGEHPFTQGSLCPKMAQYEKTVHSPQRLTTPMLRIGPKGSGQFRETSWEEALQVIATRWQVIMAEHGAEAILPCSYAGTLGMLQRNAGHAFFHRLGASRLVRTLCSPAKEYGWQAVMGDTKPSHPDEVLYSDLIVIWGSNTVATNIHFLKRIKEAKRRGAVVWLVETYHTPAAAIADRVFIVKPSSDGALALGIAHVLARDEMVDNAFLAQYTVGYTEWKDKILSDYCPEIVAQLTGLATADIEEFAWGYARAKAPFLRIGSGLSRYGNGAMNIRTVVCLPALVGAWHKKGGGALPDIGTGAAFPLRDVITREDLMAKPTREININQLGAALTELKDPKIMSLYVYHSNPAAVVPDQNQVLQGLAREDLFTVVHERFMTDTAKYADVLLPATTSLEHSDLYRAYGHFCLQRAYPAISPIGQAKSNWDVFCALARAMNFSDTLFSRSADEMIDELLDNPNAWLAQIDMDKLRSGQAVELPIPPHLDPKQAYGTPSGKIEIFNNNEQEPLPRYLKPHGDEAEFWLMTAPSIYCLNSSFNERPELLAKRNRMELMMNATDAQRKGLHDGQLISAFNTRGEVTFYLSISPQVPAGVVVAEGVWNMEQAPGKSTVNALTSQRLTDRGLGSTFYDTKVNIRVHGESELQR